MARYKLMDDTKVPSVTTIIHELATPSLYYWNNKQGLLGIDTTKSVQFEAQTGTLLHNMVETHILSKTEYMLTEGHKYTDAHITNANRAYQLFRKWSDEHNFEDVHTEMSLVSEKYKYAGTIDIYCKLDGLWTLIDIKTSGYVYKNQLLQVAAYKNLLIENNIPVERVIILSVDKYEDVPALEEELKDSEYETYFQIFTSLIDIHEYKKILDWK